MLGIGYRVSRLTEVGRQRALPYHVIDAILEHGALLAVHHNLAGEVCLDVRPDVGHQRHVGLVNQERKLSRHIIGNTYQARTRHTFSLSSGTGNLCKKHVGVDDIGKQLHAVHVIMLEFTERIVIQYQLAHRLNPPQFPLPECQHHEADVSSLSSR